MRYFATLLVLLFVTFVAGSAIQHEERDALRAGERVTKVAKTPPARLSEASEAIRKVARSLEDLTSEEYDFVVEALKEANIDPDQVLPLFSTSNTGLQEREAEPATAIEYGLIAALISVAIISGASSIGSSLNAKFSNVASKLVGRDAEPTAAPTAAVY